MMNSLDDTGKGQRVKVGAIIQARIGSERLPGKSLMDVGLKPIVQHIIENLKTSKRLSSVILATTDKKEDIPLLELAKKLGVGAFRGSENDVLSRYAEAAKIFGLDLIVRVTGDNILTDIDGMDKTIDFYSQEKKNLVSNGGENGYPLGTAVEVFSADLLNELNKNVISKIEREHVTLHAYKNPQKYSIAYLNAPPEFRSFNARLTIDTPEDLTLIRELYKKLEKSKRDFKLQNVMACIEEHQNLKEINAHIRQRSF